MKLRGRPRTTLPTTLNQDLKRIKLNKCDIQQLKNKDLEILQEIAVNIYE